MTSLKPLGPWVLVHVDPFTEKTKAGVYLPDGNAEERMGYRTAKVLAVGPGYYNEGRKAEKAKYEPLDLEVGDRVAFRGFLHDVNKNHQALENPNHSLIHANDIVGVITEE
jgi:co-chaperonin GroES (HSP10)